MFGNMLGAAWQYRGFIFGSVRREFEARYRGSLLGVLWPVLNPLAMILVYTLIFSEVMKARLPGMDDKLAYSVFLCAGLLAWGLYAEIVNRSLGMFIDNASLLKKLSFPRVCLPLIVAGNSLVNFSLIFSLFLAFLVITGRLPGLPLLAMLPLLLLQTLFALSLGLLLGVLNVFFRDVGQLMGIILQFWFWLTPIVYPLQILPGYAQQLVGLNPLSALMQAYQGLFLFGAWPQWQSLLPLLVITLLTGTLALLLFRKRGGEMVDEI